MEFFSNNEMRKKTHGSGFDCENTSGYSHFLMLSKTDSGEILQMQGKRPSCILWQSQLQCMHCQSWLEMTVVLW